MSPSLACLLSLIFLGGLADAALSDFRRYLIPNRDALILLAGFALYAWARDLTPVEIMSHLGAAAVLFVVGALLFALRVWGGGDVKLLAAVGLWTGFYGLPRLLLVMCLTGGMLSLVLLIWRRRTSVSINAVPYGIAIAAGGLSWWWQSLLPFV